jgi:hypothetical protein
MEWLKQIAPTIATAMGGPLAGMAVSAISKAIGVEPDQVQDIISNNKLTAEQIAQVKIAEIELQKQEQELGLNFEKLAVENTKDARDMQKQTRSIVPALLTGITVLGFFTLLIGAAANVFTLAGSDVLMLLLGVLARETASVYNFWLGSSSGSQTKTDLLSKAPAIK